MQWLLRLIRGAAGDARAALAAVPESVVRDAAGWLIFVVRWGHADLLGGCDIAGLVQVGCTLACLLMEISGRTRCDIGKTTSFAEQALFARLQHR